MPTQAIPYIIILGFMFGSSLLVSRFGLSQFDALTYVGIRITLTSFLFLMIFIFSKKRKFPKGRKLWKQGAFLGVMGTAIPMSLINLSMLYQSSGITALLLTMGPAITVVLAAWFLDDEPLTKRKIFGVVLALSGALLLILLGETGLPDVAQANPLGYIFVIIAMIAGSIGTVYTRKHMKEQDPIEVTGIRMFFATLIILPLSFLSVGFDLSRVTVTGYAALGWATIVGTFLAFLLSFYNTKKFGATASAMAAYVVTIVGSLGGVLLLGETFTPGMFVGMVLIVGGIAVINKRRRQTA